MKKVSVTEAENNLSALIAGLESGSSVLIVDRGRPVARLEPAMTDYDVSHLERRGLVRPRRRDTDRTLFTTAPPSARMCASDALIAERRESR